MNRLLEFDRIATLISRWDSEIRNKNAFNYFDINRISEGFACKLLNEIYDYQLIDLNKVKKNFPGIDLGDETKAKIAFQVTSRRDSNKIIKTLETFINKCLNNIYTNGIRFLIIRSDEVKLGKKNYRDIYPNFNENKHIIYLKDLEKKIEKIYDDDFERFKRIKNLLEKEFMDNYSISTPYQNVSFPEIKKEKNIFMQDCSEQLEKGLKILVDEKTMELCNNVFRKGSYPGLNKMDQAINKLINYLENTPVSFSFESLIESFITISDGFLFIQNEGYLLKSRKYYEKAVDIYKNLKDQSKCEERLLRLRAKLLFLEGEKQESLNSLIKSEDPKTISFWLALSISAGKLTDVYNYISSHEIKVEFVCEAIHVYVWLDEINKAEDLFKENFHNFNKVKSEKKLEVSPFKGEVFFEKLYFSIINALYLKALNLTGKSPGEPVFPNDLSNEAKILCKKTLQYIDMFFKNVSRNSADDNYRVSQILLIEMSVSYLIGDFNRSDNTANLLLYTKPINKQVVAHFMQKIKTTDKKLLEIILQKVKEDYSNDLWGLLTIADIENRLQHIENSWIALSEAIKFVKSEKEKIDFVILSIELCINLKKLNNLYELIKDFFPSASDNKLFLDGYYQWHLGNHEKSIGLFYKIDFEKISDDLKALIKFCQANYAIKNEKLEDSKIFLIESYRIKKNPLVLELLLYVLTKLQDDQKVLKIAEEIESLDMADDQVIFLKAQAARNLRKFDKSESSWKYLFDKFPNNPKYAFGLAHVLSINEKEDEALKILEPFIHPDDQFDSECLMLAGQIFYINKNDPKEAFRILDKCFSRMENNLELLRHYMEIGFKVGQEKKANQALKKLLMLEKDIDDSNKILRPFSLDEAKDSFKQYYDSYDILLKQYINGQIPRILLSNQKRIPFYLDWSIRTQELKLSISRMEDFTIYSTNGFHVEYNKTRRKPLVRVTSPKEVDEIVIDYDALITIHRLGLIEKLTIYKKIYYPGILKKLWKYELTQYKHHQYKQEKVYRSLNKKLQDNIIKKIETPISDYELNSLKRNLLLAHSKSILYIDNYTKQKEFLDFPKVNIIRLSQLVDFSIEKGELGVEIAQKIKKNIKGEPPLILENWEDNLHNNREVLVELTTLEIMEETGITQILLNMGIQIDIEKFTANQIYNNVLNLDFQKNVSEHHQDLMKKLKDNPKFKSFFLTSQKKQIDVFDDMYDESAFVSLLYAKEKQYHLLTDDRWTQIIGSNKTFGTDIFFKDLFEGNSITLEEYSDSFLQLCQWRYRFLVPDVRIFIYYANQFKNSLPGKKLRILAGYFRSCIEDSGLFLGIEPTEPPTPIGFKYYLNVIDAWLLFLSKLWQESDLEDDKLCHLTDWVFKYAIPDLPRNIPEQRRLLLYGKVEEILIQKLFNIVILSDNHIQLHSFLKKSLNNIFLRKEKIISILKKYIEFLTNTKYYNEIPNKRVHSQEVFRKQAIIKLLETFYGQKFSLIQFPIELASFLNQNGFNLKLSEIKESPEEIEKIKKILSQELNGRKSCDDYVEINQFVLRKSNKSFEILKLHYLISHHSDDIKKQVLDLIFNSKDISNKTKSEIESIKDGIFQNDEIKSVHASIKIQKMLLCDFYYAKSLFLHSPTYQNYESSNEAWQAVLNPNLDSVRDKIPFLLKNEFDENSVLNNIDKKNIKLHDLNSIFDLLLREIYFIPIFLPSLFSNLFKFDTSNDENKNKMNVFSSKDVFYALDKWIQNHKDPMAYLLVMEMLLYLLTCDSINRKDLIESKEFNFVFERILEIFLFENTDEMIFDKLLYENIQLRWLIRWFLAKYYLSFIDLRLKNEFDEEQKVAISWWMARELETSLLNNLENITIEDEIYWIKKSVFPKIKDELQRIRLEHFFNYEESNLSISRYYVFFSHPSFLHLATSMLYLNKNKKIHNKMQQYQMIYNKKVKEYLVRSTGFRMISGEGQIGTLNKSILPFLWNIPLSVSGPFFFEKYYKDNTELFSEEDKIIMDISGIVSSTDYLNQELNNLDKILESKDRIKLMLLLSNLKIYFYLNGKLPKVASKIFKRKELISSIFSFDDPLNLKCILELILIVGKAVTVGDYLWLKNLITQLKIIDLSNIDYNRNDKNDLVLALVSLAYLSHDLSILSPILEAKRKNSKINEIVDNLKSQLENTIPLIPYEKREYIRKIINEFDSY